MKTPGDAANQGNRTYLRSGYWCVLLEQPEAGPTETLLGDSRGVRVEARRLDGGRYKLYATDLVCQRDYDGHRTYEDIESAEDAILGVVRFVLSQRVNAAKYAAKRPDAMVDKEDVCLLA